ncbi:hypothetical protein MMAD_03930 [Mycolicibacterium madagascariense]|uniref:DUF998 domain-containing protein n=1 Tax=Mycolicibacterium madagascariense TaxID=212765 RepID=A0A7I7XCI2_9MYCO|nr:DUF998 domain-containing protein [Mycolicibacterium madagascariense]MCV7012852.1 DUF998 domain-containing protein [Mycolicibacterium madagascariense]BBZ26098.1 hypothetical protein MMAD_03930 [Mycolicibacterium madagascariense]
MSVRAGAACWLIAGVAYPSAEAIAAHAPPHYDYARNFISDLGRPDSPLSPLMNAAFVIQGTLFFVGAALVARGARGRGRTFVACAAFNAIGNVTVASVPSGVPAHAWVHATGAVLAILGGNAAILASGAVLRSLGAHRRSRRTSIVLAATGLTSFALLAVASTTSTTVLLPAATWERGSVYTIIAWQSLTAVYLLTGWAGAAAGRRPGPPAVAEEEAAP